MKDNLLRQILSEGRPSLSTRLSSLWPTFTEALGSTGHYDYVEILAEYAPLSLLDMENVARAAELHGMATMLKLDFENRGFVAQKAVGAGFQALLFADCHNAEEVRQCVQFVKPDTPMHGGRFGYPARRFIGYQPNLSQMDHAKRLSEVVVAIMIEKSSAVDEIEAICAVPGVDMVQFGPSDFSMSSGFNRGDYDQACREAERLMIETALRHGVQPRCEIKKPEDAAYYRELGVKHFSLGDQMDYLMQRWIRDGGALRAMLT